MAESRLLVNSIHGATVVTFRNSTILDSAVIEAIGRDLYALVDEKATRKIILDFTGVNFLASQAIGVLITLRKKADAIKGRVAICGLKDQLRQVFSIMKLEHLFSFHTNETEALAEFDI